MAPAVPSPKPCFLQSAGPEGCKYMTPDGLTFEQQLADIEAHCRYVHPQPAAPVQPRVQGAKAASLPRPQIDEDTTEEEWKHFVEKWSRYRRSCLGEATEQHVMDQLWATCSESLEKNIFKTKGVNSASNVDSLLKIIKEMAVKKQNVLVNIVNFLNMSQDHDEPVKNFIARLKGQSQVCNFTLPQGQTDYTEKMVMHQLICGLASPGLQEEVLSHTHWREAELKEFTLESLKLFVEGKESGKREQSILSKSGGLNKMSAYQKLKGQNVEEVNTKPGNKLIDPEALCGWCKTKGHGKASKEDIRKLKCPAFGKACEACGRLHHSKAACRTKDKSQQPASSLGQLSASPLLGSASFCQLISLPAAQVSSTQVQRAGYAAPRAATGGRGLQLDHHLFDMERGWVRGQPEAHPTLQVSVAVDRESYSQLSLTEPRFKTKQVGTHALADSGAQMTAAGLELVHALGATKRDLIPVSTKIAAANHSDMGLLGALLINVSAKSDRGAMHTTKEICYICSSISTLFLSKSAMKALKIVSESFPLPCNDKYEINSSTYLSDQFLEKEEEKEKLKREKEKNNCEENCSCPRREMPPPAPTTLPFPLQQNEDDRLRLSAHICKMYAKSAFNQCEAQPLPMMTDLPPLSLNIDPAVKPTAIHKPRPVPVYWQEKVKRDLDRDEKIGVLEKVLIGHPSTWISPMVCVAKSNGDPRRTVDYQKLNKAAVRQTHSTETPFNMASGIPQNTYKTVLDAWNGFHSIPLRKEDMHLTTFLSPWGRYWYRVAPQGYLASGDAYTARYDEIVRDFGPLKKCVDDTCLWSDTLEECYYRTCQYLTLCSSKGIVFNASKFQFGAKTVNFLGFTVTEDSVKPSDKYLAAIRDFPTPTDMTGVRSWYGLVNQVNYAFSNSEAMLPFRHLLKPDEAFVWTDKLEKAFKMSKESILEAVKNGVRTFDLNKKTCVATDWSKQGIGFVLLQKTCPCEADSPICCSDGWVVTFCGSRFTTGPETRYASVEGEALAVCWALEKCRYFILGCPDLIVATDHKPLLKLLGDRTLEDISNPRLLRLKEKTFRFRYKIIHVPGKSQKAADCSSRTPVHDTSSDEDEDRYCSSVRHFVSGIRVAATEAEYLEAVQRDLLTLDLAPCTLSSLSASTRLISWERLNLEAAADPDTRDLHQLISQGLPETADGWPDNLKSFSTMRDKLTTVENAVACGDRLVVPQKLRREVLEVLHCGHQGCTGMQARARDTVYWPGLDSDIARTRKDCNSCDKVAPSLPAAPPTTLPSPEYPFQMIASDYFSFAGVHYFVLVDRYSNWPSVYKATGDGAKELVRVLREYMGTFGVMSEISSDGGSQYTSEAFKQLCQKYQIHSRISSVAFPHSNAKAEGCVKLCKRLIRDNIGPNGSLNTDGLLAGLLNFRNTPDRDTHLSPAQIIFGRRIKDYLPIKPGQLNLHPEWRLTMEQREIALAKRHVRRGAELSEHTKVQSSLNLGQPVMVQNQEGNKPLRWDKTGIVVEVKAYDQYVIKMDGSGYLSLRNRKFLRPHSPFNRDESSSEANGGPMEEAPLRRSSRDRKKPQGQR